MLVEDERRVASFAAVEALDDYLTSSFVPTEFLGRVKSDKEIIPLTSQEFASGIFFFCMPMT